MAKSSRHGGGYCFERAATATARVSVPLSDVQYRVAPAHPGGIVIEGIAITAGWGSADMRSAKVERMPLPLLWRHDVRNRIGTVHDVTADADAVRFEATIAPRGTAGYVDAHLAHIINYFENVVREGEHVGVSCHALWKGSNSFVIGEVSLCPTGANHAAVVLRATHPGGYLQRWTEPAIVRVSAARQHQVHNRDG